MPKQFLRGIDQAGLAPGLLVVMRPPADVTALMADAEAADAAPIAAFAEQHWVQQPWLKDVASRTVARLR